MLSARDRVTETIKLIIAFLVAKSLVFDRVVDSRLKLEEKFQIMR